MPIRVSLSLSPSPSLFLSFFVRNPRWKVKLAKMIVRHLKWFHHIRLFACFVYVWDIFGLYCCSVACFFIYKLASLDAGTSITMNLNLCRSIYVHTCRNCVWIDSCISRDSLKLLKSDVHTLTLYRFHNNDSKATSRRREDTHWMKRDHYNKRRLEKMLYLKHKFHLWAKRRKKSKINSRQLEKRIVK